MNIYRNGNSHYFLHNKWRLYRIAGCDAFLVFNDLLQRIAENKLEKGECNITVLWEDDIELVFTFDENKNIKLQFPEYFV